MLPSNFNFILLGPMSSNSHLGCESPCHVPTLRRKACNPQTTHPVCLIHPFKSSIHVPPKGGGKERREWNHVITMHPCRVHIHPTLQGRGGWKNADWIYPSWIHCNVKFRFWYYRTRMAKWALKCPIIILITARSLCSYNNILIIIQHPWTILTENSAS